MRKCSLVAMCVAGAIFSNASVAVTADYYSNGTRVNDADYIYFSDGYMCSESSYWSVPDPENYTVLTDGQTLWDGRKSELLMCCEDDGYWITFGNVSSVPAGDTCAPDYNYVSLGGNRYCRAQMTAKWNWCHDVRFSGVTNTFYGACEYTNGTCSTFTHCGRGYYKDGNTCKACPNGGTTAGYTDNGIAACYLPNGTAISDESGVGIIAGGNCAY